MKPTPPEKPLPANLDFERMILGAILLDNTYLAKASEHLHSGDLYDGRHERIFRRMVAMVEAKTPIELRTLDEELRQAGELEGAGGTPYLASLLDGMPRVANVEHYAKIVSEKARQRSIIHATHGWQQQAWNTEADSQQILADITEYVKLSSNGHGENHLIAVDLKDFLTMKFDAIDFIIEPILPVSNSAMIFSPTGAGKTYIMLYMAYCIAAGCSECFVWNVPSARRVVYVDGEMDAPTLQERITEIARGMLDTAIPKENYFKLITPDLQPKKPPRINTKEGRLRIEEHATEGGLIVLDNIITLCPGADDKETEDWAAIQEWILHLRRHKVGVFLVQHAGKSGDQLGTSKKEIQLSCNLKLRTASDYTPEEGLKVEARLTKLRRRGKDNRWDPRWAQPFEIVLRVDAGAATFTNRPMRDLLRKRALEMLTAGMRENDVAQETGLDRFAIYRLNRKRKELGATSAEAAE
jgi:DnaB-like helicase N terminal domain/AAA domain